MDGCDDGDGSTEAAMARADVPGQRIVGGIRCRFDEEVEL